MPTANHRLAITACCLAAVLSAGTPPAPDHAGTFTGNTMGTTYTVQINASPLPVPAEKIRAAIGEELATIDAALSTYRDDSELSRFNHANTLDWTPVSPTLFQLLAQAQRISRLTGGAFDMSVGPLVNLWGFGPGGHPGRIPGVGEIDRARDSVGYARLEMDSSRKAVRKTVPGMFLDPNAIGQGYAVDLIAARLESFGLQDYLVELGGEVRARGHNLAGAPWQIGIERPLDSDQRSVERVIGLTNASLATSGDYRHYFEIGGVRYSHEIDPATGSPIRHRLASVTVVMPACTYADAMATALMVLGPDKGFRLASGRGIAAYFIVRTDRGFEERQTAAFQRIAAAGGSTK